ncbi:MAG TPA: DUF3455 domain-containing protein [Chitinophagaceae bacterium]|nr:DUF3455 domain-containing protein [Chitinophagaceae bacterium]
MHTKQHSLRTFLAMPALLLLALVACERDNEVHHGSPAQQIEASESLVLPASIELPANPHGYTRVATYYAKGVQMYKAQQKAGSPGVFEWVLVAPDAKLYDKSNTKVGTHGAGPFWEVSALDSIFAQHFAPPKTAPSPNANSVDWLLLQPKVGKTPTGIFANVQYIHRIATEGGKAPSTPPANAGATTEVKYTAIYRFTRKN